MQILKRSVVGLVLVLGGAVGCSSDSSKANADAIDASVFGNPVVAGAGGGGGGNNASGAGVNGGALCPEGFAKATRVTPQVILVLDGSCSMSTDYPANGQPSATMCQSNPKGRWSALRAALVDPTNGVVTRLQSAVKFGLAVFGTVPTCPIPGTPINPVLNNLQAIDGALPAVQPGLYTPTGAALDWVYSNMIDNTVGPDKMKEPAIVILATDGEPNSCGNAGMGGFGGGGVQTNYQPSVDAITKGQSMGVKTFVISLADSSGTFHDHLQQLANLGAGLPATGGSNAPLYEPGTPDELAADLQLVVGGAVGCDVALNGELAAADACKGTVMIDTGAPLPCNDPDGWILADSRHIRLQGKACKSLMSTPNASVTASFPCGVFTVE